MRWPWRKATWATILESNPDPPHRCVTRQWSNGPGTHLTLPIDLAFGADVGDTTGLGNQENAT